MEITKEAKDFIKKEEGLVLHVYKDVAGLDTIGYGHLLTAEDKRNRVFVDGITQEQADQLFDADVKVAADEILKLVKVPITPGQLAALLSFTFNLGSSALAQSTLLKKLNSGDYKGAADEFVRWNKARDPKTNKLVENAGLTKRRKAEVALWNQS